MAKPKKGKKKPKIPIPIEQPPAIVIDHTYYEDQIAELNRILAGLRSRSVVVEDKNAELKEKLATIKQDHEDIVIYLNKILQEASLKLQQAKDEFTKAQDSHNDEVEEFKKKIAEMEDEQREMVDQLQSEIAMYEGRLGAFEEFRQLRNDLMKKFEEQEHAMEEQKMRHKTEIYEDEKFYTIEKDKLKKRMEARLVQLNKEFQEITEIRLASSMNIQTKHNIRLNNEYNVMLKADQKLYDKYVQTKSLDDTLRHQLELREGEREMAVNRATRLHNKIEKMTMDFEATTAKLTKCKRDEQIILAKKEELIKAKKTLENIFQKKRIVEQNIEIARNEREHIINETERYKEEIVRLDVIRGDVLNYIESALVGQKNPLTDELLKRITEILQKGEGLAIRKASVATVPSVSAIYAIGDLGFVPKPIKTKRKFPLKRHRSQQVGPSFHKLQEQLAESEYDVDITISTRKLSTTLSSISSTESSPTPSAHSSIEDEPRASDISTLGLDFNAFMSSFDLGDTRKSILQILGDEGRASVARRFSDMEPRPSMSATEDKENVFVSAEARLSAIADMFQSTANLSENYFGPVPGAGIRTSEDLLEEKKVEEVTE